MHKGRLGGVSITPPDPEGASETSPAIARTFGTAFTLATNIDVIPMVIYTEFTLSANIAMASALSIVLGIVTWALLLIARSLSGTTVAAGG